MTRKIKVIVKSANLELIGELYNTNTADKVWEALPFESTVNTWGEEIYFDIPVTLNLEPGARAKVEIGEIGYWDVGKSMCIFWGRTPASRDNQPIAASPVNVFGKMNGDPKVLKSVKDGDEILVEQF